MSERIIGNLNKTNGHRPECVCPSCMAQSELAAPAGSLADMTPQAAHAFQTLNKCVLDLRPRGDSMADDIWTAMCELSHCFRPQTKPTENNDSTEAR